MNLTIQIPDELARDVAAAGHQVPQKVATCLSLSR
jgi:hypothetical protein